MQILSTRFFSVLAPESGRGVQSGLAELDNVAEDSYKDSTLIRQCRPSDPSLVQMIAPEVVRESVPRECVKGVSLTFHQHCSCTPALLLMLSHRHLRYRITTFVQLQMVEQLVNI